MHLRSNIYGSACDSQKPVKNQYSSDLYVGVSLWPTLCHCGAVAEMNIKQNLFLKGFVLYPLKAQDLCLTSEKAFENRFPAQESKVATQEPPTKWDGKPVVFARLKENQGTLLHCKRERGDGGRDVSVRLKTKGGVWDTWRNSLQTILEVWEAEQCLFRRNREKEVLEGRGWVKTANLGRLNGK